MSTINTSTKANICGSEKMLPLIFLVLVMHGNSCFGRTLLVIHDEGDDTYGSSKMRYFPLQIFIAPKFFTNSDLDKLCAMGRPDLLLDFTKNGVPSETIKKYARHMQIPTISTTYGDAGDIIEWKSLTPEQKKYLVQIKRPEDVVPDMIRRIVIMNKYKDAGILYDNSIYITHKMKSLLINLDVRHSILECTEESLSRMIRMKIFNYFIIGKFTALLMILHEVCTLDLYKPMYSFHAITLTHGSYFQDCRYAKYVITQPQIEARYLINGLTNEMHYDLVKMGVKIVNMVGKLKNFTECPDDELNYIPPGDDVVDLYPLLEEVMAKEELLMLKYVFNGVRNIPILPMVFIGVQVDNFVMNTEMVGSWNSVNGGEFINAGKLKKYASKIIYKIAVAVQEPFLYPDENSVYNYSGFCVDLIHEISVKVGFSFNLYRPETGIYRADFEQVLVEVMEKRADIAIGSISVTPERLSMVEFTISFYEAVGMQIMMKIPETSKSFFKIIEVLHVGVWLGVMAVFFVTSALLWSYDRWSPYSYRNTTKTLEDFEEGKIFTAKESLWFILASLTLFENGDPPKNLSGRVIIASFWLFGYMIISAYSANLSAFITASYFETGVESLEDLFDQQEIKYGIANNTLSKKFFDTAVREEAEIFNFWLDNVLGSNGTHLNQTFYGLDYPIENKFTRMLKFMRDGDYVLPNFEDGVKMVRSSTESDKFAFIGDGVDIKFAVSTNCDLQSVGDQFVKKFLAFAIKNGSDLKDPLDQAIIELMNDRVLEKIKNKWWRDNPKVVDCNNDKYQANGITLQNIVGVFVVIGGGGGIALIINWIEKVVNKANEHFATAETLEVETFEEEHI